MTKMDTKLAKKGFLDAYARTFGNIAQSCKSVSISRQTYYNWLERDPKFAQSIEEIEPNELFADFVESKLIQKINDLDTTAIIFAAKTRLKHRGYIERTEVTGKDGAAIEVNTNKADYSKLSVEELRLLVELEKKASNE